MKSAKRLTRYSAMMLLCVHAVLSFHCAVTDFATFDEAGHLAAGVAYWQRGTYYLYNVNPPLTKLIAAAPLLLVGPNTESIELCDAREARRELDVGDNFARDNKMRLWHLLVLGR